MSARRSLTRLLEQIKVDREAIAEFCRRHGIRSLSLYGSVTGDDFGPASDVDVLAEFRSDRKPGLAFFDMESELSELMQWGVDLNTPAFLHPNIREKVKRDAVAVYSLERISAETEE
jgi:predicted nucleotidyltransferase